VTPTAKRRPPPRRTERPSRARVSAPPPHRPPKEGLGGEQVEGRQSVLELLRAGKRRVRRVLIAEALDSSAMIDQIEAACRKGHVPITYVARTRFERDARTEGHQGVLAHADPVATTTLEALVESARAFLVVCDSLTDPRNLGAVLRSAEGAGVSGVVLPKHRASRLSPTVAKTAAGALEYLAFCEVGGVPSAIDRLNRAGVLTVGLDAGAGTSLYDLDLSGGRVALVVGGEQGGLAQLTRKRCAVLASLPQLGRIGSLNASVAASVACYEVARQRRRG
jgi:23S rRNA (guanosine2251-2'-O)-methyltransferase